MFLYMEKATNSCGPIIVRSGTAVRSKNMACLVKFLKIISTRKLKVAVRKLFRILSDNSNSRNWAPYVSSG